MIWNKKLTVKDLNAHKDNTLLSALGIEYTEISSDSITAKMPVDNRTVQTFGVLHGGASVALAETIGSTASFLALPDNENKNVVGLDINANHLKAVSSGWVYGTAKPIRIGRKIHVWQIKIVNENNDMVCICRLTTMIIDTPK